MTWINDKPFAHITRRAVYVEADRCDLVGGATMHIRGDMDASDIAEAAAETFGYHAANILPRLNGFAGYDALKIKIITK